MHKKKKMFESSLTLMPGLLLGLAFEKNSMHLAFLCFILTVNYIPKRKRKRR